MSIVIQQFKPIERLLNWTFFPAFLPMFADLLSVMREMQSQLTEKNLKRISKLLRPTYH